MKSTPLLLFVVCLAASTLNAAEPDRSDWSRVRKLSPGTEIIVTRNRSPSSERLFIAADEASLTALDLLDPALPSRVRTVLREAASNHPEFFSKTRAHETFVLDKHVRLEAEGVFVIDRKVADRDETIETLARDDVTEVMTRRKGRGFWGHLGPLGGYFVGGMAGGFANGLMCQSVYGRDRCDTGAFLSGMAVGGIVGAAAGFYAAHRVTEEVVYRAP